MSRDIQIYGCLLLLPYFKFPKSRNGGFPGKLNRAPGTGVLSRDRSIDRDAIAGIDRSRLADYERDRERKYDRGGVRCVEPKINAWHVSDAPVASARTIHLRSARMIFFRSQFNGHVATIRHLQDEQRRRRCINPRARLSRIPTVLHARFIHSLSQDNLLSARG